MASATCCPTAASPRRVLPYPITRMFPLGEEFRPDTMNPSRLRPAHQAVLVDLIVVQSHRQQGISASTGSIPLATVPFLLSMRTSTMSVIRAEKLRSEERRVG